MAGLKHLLWASVLISVQCWTRTAAMATAVAADYSGQQIMSRHSASINMEALPVQATSPIRIPTLAAQKQGVSAPLLGVQDQGLSQQVPSGPTPLQQLDAASVSTDLSASEQHVLQHLGWSLGRRGLEALKALADQSTSSDSSAPIVLKDFWNHFSSLSWLPHQKRLRQGAGKLMLRHAAQPAQHDEGLDAGQHAQHAKHEDFKIAQQVLQQVAKHAMQETAYVQSMRHIDMVNANSDKPSQKHEPSAGRLVTKSSGSNELLHFEIVQEPAAKDFPVPVPPQPAQGAEGQQEATVVIIKGSDEQSGQALSEEMDQHPGDYIEWPSDDQLPMDDDTMTAWAGEPTEKEDVQPGSGTGLSPVHSWQRDQLTNPSEYGTEADAQPQIDLARAKQGFARYLTGVHAHPNFHQPREQQEVQNRQAVTGLVYSQDSNGVKYTVEDTSPGQLKHSSLGV